MVREARIRFNASFSPEKYNRMLADIDDAFDYPVPFRIAESPVFVPGSFLRKMEEAAETIIAFLQRKDFKDITQKAIPPDFNVPAEDAHPLFLALDFGVCRDAEGALVPQLIELQGFPSLFGWEHFLAGQYRRHFDVPDGYSHLFGLDDTSYESLLRQHIVGDHNPENVILLDIHPATQHTYIDFLITRRMLGVKPVCITELRTEGRDVYYMDDGKKVPVHRIYNRVIPDELQQRNIRPAVGLADDLNVEWAGHPNWFFRVSKYIMPYLDHPCIPVSRFLDQVRTEELAGRMEQYVLKPLFSFSGSGVRFHVTEADLRAVTNPGDYLLQEKVAYEPVLEGVDGRVKAELRLLYLWEPGQPRPRLVVNMARLSRGDMVGVKYNKNKTWVGGSVGFYEI